MAQQELFNQIIALLNDAMLEDALWPKASRLIDQACGARGNVMIFGNPRPNGSVDLYFTECCYRGEERPEQMREYLMQYHAVDEHVPRMRRLPDSRIVSVAEQFTAEERKRSRCYNEAYLRYETQNALEVRLDGPGGSHIGWALANPVDSVGWSSSRVEMFSRLLPHLRQYVLVRSALAEANAYGATVGDLLDHTRVGIVQMDRRGRVVAMNDRAGRLLRENDGLSCKDGSLVAPQSADQSRLDTLLAQALPRFGDPAVSSSMLIRRPSLSSMLILHVLPVTGRDEYYQARRIAALLLMIDPMDSVRIDAGLVQDVLGLSPREARIAVLLAEGRTLRQIAAMTGRRYSTIRSQLHHIFTKLRLSRQLELVEAVRALSRLPASKD